MHGLQRASASGCSPWRAGAGGHPLARCALLPGASRAACRTRCLAVQQGHAPRLLLLHNAMGCPRLCRLQVMLRVGDLDRSIKFYTGGVGPVVISTLK